MIQLGESPHPAFLRTHTRNNKKMAILYKAYSTVRDTIRFYRTVIELNHLSDKELLDLGITSRAEIPMIAASASIEVNK
jgi:uncharacterized protein YjiS (DUF1127 family)